MAFEGDLSNLSLGDVLQTIAMSRQVGTFVIRGTEERRLACGPNGVSLLSTRTSLGLRIGEVLCGTQKVTREQLEAALKVQRRRRDTPIGALLLEEGACTEEDLRGARRYLAAEEIFDLFLWKQGKFEFLAGDPDLSGPFSDLWFDVGSVAMEAARRLDELPRVVEKVPASEVFVRARGARPQFDPKKSADVLRLFEFVDGSRTVEDVIDDFYRGRFDTWKGLEALLEAGLIVPASPEEVEAAAVAAMSSRQYARASRLYQRLRDHDPADDSIRQHIADALRESGARREACIEMVAVGQGRLTAGKTLPAVEAFRQAILLDGTNAAAHEGLMHALAESGRIDDAADAARAAANARIAVGDYEDACRLASEGLAHREGDTQLLVLLANTHQVLGRSAEAVKLLTDVAKTLEKEAGNDQRLLDVYRRILQIEPTHRDALRRVEEIAARERTHRRRLVRRLSVVAGVLVAAMAAVPFLRGPAPEEVVAKARLLVDAADAIDPSVKGGREHKAEEALDLLKSLDGRQMDQDASVDRRGLELRIEGLLHPPQSGDILKRLDAEMNQHFSEGHNEILSDPPHVAQGLAAYAKGLDLLDGPDARKLRLVDSTIYEKVRADAAHEVQIAISDASTMAQRVAARLTGVRDRYVDEVWKQENLDVLHELVDASEKALALANPEEWAPTPDLVAALVARTAKPTDASDVKAVESVASIVEAHKQVTTNHDRALSRARRKEVKEGYKAAYSNGGQFEREGRLEEALGQYEPFLALCAQLRAGTPEELYKKIVHELFEGEMRLEDRIRQRRDRLATIVQACEDAQNDEANDAIESAFSGRRRLVHDNPDIDFSRRFQMPLRIESAPPAAEVFLVDGSPGGRALGRTPVVTQYPVAGNVRYEVRLEGYKMREFSRHGALEDASGVERVELVKLALWTSKPAGTTEAAPSADGEAILVCGRNGIVRRLDARTGTECAPFDGHLLDGFAGSPAVHGQCVFAASLDGKGFILSRIELKQLHTFATAAVRAAPLVTSRGVVLADEAGTLRLVDDSGASLWTKKVGRVKCDLGEAPGERVILVTSDGELQLVEEATGDVAVRRTLRQDTTWTAPVVRGNRAFLANEAGEVVCVDVVTLQTLWTHTADGPVHGRVAASDLRVVACSVGGAVHVLDAETGNVLGRAQTGGKTGDGLLCLDDGGFIAVTRAGNVTRYDVNGELVWRFDAGEPVSAPPRLVDGTIILVTFKGTVIALAP